MANQLKILLLIDFSEEYGRALLRGITKYSQINGPWSFCKMPPFIREKYGVNGILNFATEWGAQGIIGQLYNNREFLKLRNSGIPVIAEDFKERFTDIPNITSNYEQTGVMAAEYFLSKGYENFAYYGFKDYVWSRERMAGYKKKIESKGFNVYEFNYDSKNDHKLWYYKTSPLSEWLRRLPKPVALFACDDNQAMHVIDACNLAGLHIPDEVAVLGVDNDEVVCNLSNPPLSSVYLDTENAGYMVALRMEQMILNNTTQGEDIIVNAPVIITRQSTDIFATKDTGVLQALNFIRENALEKIQVQDIVKHVAISRRAIERRFLKCTGKTIYQKILQSKIEKAALLLLNTKHSVLDISLQCGFDDQKNFSRIFQKFYKTTPLHYRKNFSNI